MPGKKRKAQSKGNNSYVSDDEADQMFRLWCQIRNIGKGGGFKGVAAEFGRSRTTVIRVSKRFRWDERFDEIQRRLHLETDKKIESEQVKNLKKIRALRDKLLFELLQRSRTTGGKIADVVRLVNLESEIIGKLPDNEPKEADVDKNEAREALELLRSVSTAKLESLAEQVVFTPEKKKDGEEEN